MKIYFEDGELLKQTNLNFKYDFTIDAKYGYSYCNDMLEMIKRSATEECIVYTNSLIALDNNYAWNKKLELPEIYMRAGEHQIFYRIDKLTQKELHRAHNIMRMYIGNEFRNLIKE